MSRNIKSLLNKKVWKEAEVGHALLASLIHDVKHKGEEHEPLFSQEELSRMEKSLTTSTNFITYGTYSTLYSSIIDSFNRGQAMQQQFTSGISHLLVNIRELLNVEQAKAKAQK